MKSCCTFLCRSQTAFGGQGFRTVKELRNLPTSGVQKESNLTCFSPAAEQNKEPILQALRSVLPDRGRVIEIASGTGQHIVHFAGALPNLQWLPTERDPRLLQAIARRTANADLGNILPPLALDVFEQPWPARGYDALVCINLLHIAPEAAVTALFRGAAQVLTLDGCIAIYGPFKRQGRHTAPSNARFDADLRWQNPAWGVRDLETLVAAARTVEFELENTLAMPANNFTLTFRRGGRARKSPAGY